MRIAGRATLGLAAVLLAALLLAACGGGESDSADREITDEDLILMLLPQADLGAEYADFEFDEDDSGYESNDERAADDFDPEDEAQDIDKFGRVGGYRASYGYFQALLGDGGSFALRQGVQLFEDADGASGYADDSVADRKQQVGQDDEGAVLEEVTALDVEKIGDETVAYLQKVVLSDDEGDELTLYATFVGFREGRILGGVNVGHMEDEDISSEVAALARKLHDRMLAVLAGDVTPAPTATPAETTAPAADTATPQADGTGTPQAGGTATPTASSADIAPSDFLDTFHFTSDISVTAEGGIVLNVEGDYQAPDRIACTISGGIGGVTFAKDELIVIGDDAWIDAGSGWTSTTASDPKVQTDLALCPGFADYWADFDFVEDLGGLVGGDRETVNGVPAIRYDVGDAFQGLASLGLLPPDLEGVEIELFAVWLAEDERWPVAMEMIASGDAEAWANAMIIPPDDSGSGEASLRMRVDISEVNSPSIRVSRPAGQ